MAECRQVVHAECYAFAQQFMALPEPPEGIFAVSDSVAIGALMGLKDAGYRVLEQVALVGFSNWAVSALVEPAVSSVAQPGYDIGRRASELLLREIRQLRDEEPITHEHLALEATFQVRASSLRRG